MTQSISDFIRDLGRTCDWGRVVGGRFSEVPANPRYPQIYQGQPVLAALLHAAYRVGADDAESVVPIVVEACSAKAGLDPNVDMQAGARSYPALALAAQLTRADGLRALLNPARPAGAQLDLARNVSLDAPLQHPVVLAARSGHFAEMATLVHRGLPMTRVIASEAYAQIGKHLEARPDGALVEADQLYDPLNALFGVGVDLGAPLKSLRGQTLAVAVSELGHPYLSAMIRQYAATDSVDRVLAQYGAIETSVRANIARPRTI